MTRRAVLALIVVSMLGCAKGSDDLTEPPVQKMVPFTPARDASLVQVALTTPISDIEALVNAKVQPSFAGNGTAPQQCLKAGPVVLGCTSISYNYNLARTPFKVVPGPAPNTLRLQTSIHATGQGAASGYLGNGIGAKNFAADVDVTVDLGLSLAGNGCPSVTMVPSYNWTSHPRVEVVTHAWVDMDDMANSKIGDGLKDIQTTLQQVASCDAANALLKKYWIRYAFPIVMPGSSPLVLNLEPTALLTTGTVVQNNNLSIGLAAAVITEVAEKASTGVPETGPNIRKMPLADGHLSLSVPVAVAYESLRDAILGQFGNKEIPIKLVSDKVAKVTIKDVKLYPSGDRLAVALNVDVDLPGKLFNTSGWLYLAGKPVLSDDGAILKVDDLALTRQLDSGFWSAATAVFSTQITALASRKAQLDIASKRAEATAAVNKVIAERNKTGFLTATISNLQLSGLKVVPSDKLYAFIHADAGLTTTADLKALAK